MWCFFKFTYSVISMIPLTKSILNFFSFLEHILALTWFQHSGDMNTLSPIIILFNMLFFINFSHCYATCWSVAPLRNKHSFSLTMVFNKLNGQLGVVAHAFTFVTASRRKRKAHLLSSRPAWYTKQDPGQPGIKRKTLGSSLKENGLQKELLC